MTASAFDYLYRDAGNYKVFGSVFLTGHLTPSQLNELRACLIDNEFFVAPEIPVPNLDDQLLALSDGPTEDDHMWHTFLGVRRVEELPKDAQLWGSATELLEAFRAFKAKADSR